jgi:hypothetical protein
MCLTRERERERKRERGDEGKQKVGNPNDKKLYHNLHHQLHADVYA